MSAIKHFRTCLVGLFIFSFFYSTTYAQVGIGTDDPNTMLDVNGALSLRESPDVITLTANSNNNDIPLGTTPYSVYRVQSSSSTENFGFRTITSASAVDGQIVTIINVSDVRMRVNSTTNNATNRIRTRNNVDVNINGQYGSATLQYNKTLEKWILQGTNLVGSTDSESWALDGNDGTDDTVNFIGTTDAVDLVLRTNNTEQMRIMSSGEVGIGAADPKTTLDVEGALSLRDGGELSLSGNSNAIDLSSSPHSSYRVTSGGDFGIITIDAVASADGQLVTLHNTSSFVMTLFHNNGNSINSILCPGGNTLSLSDSNSSVTLQYNGSLQRWITIGTNQSGGSASDDWALTGNIGTDPTREFIGTGDFEDLIIKTDNTERMRLEDDGQIIVNSAITYVGDRFASTGDTDEYAISAYANSTGVNSAGVYTDMDGPGDGIYAINRGSGVAGYFQKLANNNYSIYAVDGTIFGDNRDFGGEGIEGLTDTRNSSTGGLENGIWGINEDTSGTAILGGTGDSYVLPANGSGIAGSSPVLAVYGYAGLGASIASNYGNAGASFSLDSDNDPSTASSVATAVLAGFDDVNPDGGGGEPSRDSYFGGYFSANGGYAYVGISHDIDNGGGPTDYKVIGTGNNSTLINDADGIPRIMFSPEAPEIVFQDFGVGQLRNGSARIELDPILKGASYIDNEHPLKVFVTLEGECNGVYVTNKSADGFTVKELQGGRSNVSFSWQIVANRADTKNANGEVISKHVGLRLPVGPAALKPIEVKSKKLIKPENNRLKTTSKRTKDAKVAEPKNTDKSATDKESDK